MAPVTHSVDPRTGCWTPSDEETAASLFERYRETVPAGVRLEPVCGNDACANPGHIRPVRHALVAPESVTYINLPFSAVEPAAPAPVKRGPGRPRKNPR